MAKDVKISELSTKDRLDRLERLIVRALLSAPLDTSGSRLIDPEVFPRSTQTAFRKRFDRFHPTTGDEAKYAISSILSICGDDIDAEQSAVDAAEAKRVALEKEGKRKVLKAEKLAAEESMRATQEKLDALEPVAP